MKNRKYSNILYFISFVVLLTVGVQGYWAYKSYNAQKLDLLADVQNSLDVAVDNYYSALAKENTLQFLADTLNIKNGSVNLGLPHRFKGIDSLNFPEIKHINIRGNTDYTSISIVADTLYDAKLRTNRLDSTAILKFDGSNSFETLTSKIFFAIRENTLSLPRLDSIFHEELDRRQLWIDYGLEFSLPSRETQKIGTVTNDMKAQSARAVSNFLTPESQLTVYYKNTTPLIVHRNGLSLLLTFILIASIIAILLYLLHIIKQQKQLAEIKNDLISNITHEFKTPLATIAVALEGIEQFNRNHDQEKTQKYVAMSSAEVKKLTHMVDKLLETASLDSQRLALKKEPVDLVNLLGKLAVVPEAFIDTKKQISFKNELASCLVQADRFHLENLIHTLIDNAFKYGGSKIRLDLEQDQSHAIIKIHDTGSSLTKAQAAKIFDKFYRVPSGNQHDTKGFGIGLYYAKNIIEKHGGTIVVSLKGGTTFTITLPNE